MLTAFTKVEMLVGEDKYDCPVCKSLQIAKKELRFSKLPPVLTIHLKRFKFIGTRTKIDKEISFQSTLDMSKLSEDGPLYHLYGVIVHKGTAGQGHYYGYIKHKGIWYEANDHKISKVSEEQVLKQSAYMLFYDLKSNSNFLIIPDKFKQPFKKRKI